MKAVGIRYGWGIARLGRGISRDPITREPNIGRIMEGRLRLQLIGGIDTRSVAFCIHLCIHLILILIGLPPFREMGVGP